MPGAAGSSLPMIVTWTERSAGDATVTTQPRSIATSNPSRSAKNSRVSAGRSDLMLGTALLPMTPRILPVAEARQRLARVRLVEQAHAVVRLAVHRGRQQLPEALVQHR